MQRQTDCDQERAKHEVKDQTRQDRLVDAFEVAVRVVLGDVLDESRAHAKVEQIEGAGENGQQHPNAEFVHIQVRQDVRRQQQRDEEIPRTAEEIEERICDELLRKNPEERDGFVLPGNFVSHAFPLQKLGPAKIQPNLRRRLCGFQSVPERESFSPAPHSAESTETAPQI